MAKARIGEYKFRNPQKDYKNLFDWGNEELSQAGFTHLDDKIYPDGYLESHLFHDIGAYYVLDNQGNVVITCLPENQGSATRSLEEYCNDLLEFQGDLTS